MARLGEERFGGYALHARTKQANVPYSGYRVGPGDETSSACAWDGISLPPTCQGTAREAGFGLSFEARGYFHAWVFLASPQGVQARKTSKIEVGFLEPKAGRE